jgi:hypothetical protein
MMDHLVYGVTNLAEGIDVIERQTGVRPCFGGRHPGRGTHNALLSLGHRQYLEIIALDPEQPGTSASDLLFPELRQLRKPSFLAWAISVVNIDDVLEEMRSSNLQAIGPLDGARARTDGSVLSWKTLRVAAPSIALAPFFIAWDTTAVHPGEDSPAGCKLLSFQVEHTHPDRLAHILGHRASEVRIAAGPRSRLLARIATPKGEVELG